MLRIFITFFLCTGSIFSQPESDSSATIRLFKDYQDYLAASPLDTISLEEGNKLSIGYNTLVIKQGNQKRKYNHGSLWGYQNENDLYRFYDQGTAFGLYGYYKVIDQDGLVLYSKKESGGYRMSSTYVNYYYSKDLTSPIKKLSIKNLKMDFLNLAFIAEIKGLENLEKDSGEINKIYRKYY